MSRVLFVILSTWLSISQAVAQAQNQPAPAAGPPQVESFVPEGTVKDIRQVQVAFSEAMVPFGDPTRAVQPFEISCPSVGKGRWVDGRHWVYDFDKDLPAGIKCTFSLRPGVVTLTGKALGGQTSFSFSTGGPSILDSSPSDGNEEINEDQVFILELDGQPSEDSLLRNAWFAVEGVEEQIGIKIIKGDERKAVLDSEYRYREVQPDHPSVLLQAKRRFPSSARVNLVWGKGIVTESGVATDEPQTLHFKTRPPFTATFGCSRLNVEADCIPLTRMFLSFSAPVPWSKARQIVLTGPEGKKWTPLEESDSDGDEEQTSDRVVHRVSFKQPFPPKSEFRLQLPAGVQDDSGRALSNAASFPLTVRTDDYPPLAKFAADFGILEWKADPVLPVTLRDVEAEVEAREVKVPASGPGPVAAPSAPVQTMPGTILRVPADQVGQILFWLKKMNNRNRETSVFDAVSGATTRPFRLPKPNGPKAFEVVGIPLRDPGFYVVELQSEILGAALLGKPAPMFVATTALVTNLAVHFKWGLESSLVWVTSLDQARPVAGASVEVCDCSGKMLWQGKTDTQGIARISGLPDRNEPPECKSPTYSEFNRGLTVVARAGTDMAFVHSSWDSGIEPWRFDLPTEYESSLVTAHTILDRSLLRAGETVHMKHILRRHVTGGFAQLPENQRPVTLVIRHGGTDQVYEFPLKWDLQGLAESEWKIPPDAKLGQYQISFREKGSEQDRVRQWESGSFRVEEYRVPLLKASLQFPNKPLIRPSQVNVDIGVQYLAGGGASRLPVRLRYRVLPGIPSGFAELEDFALGNGRVKEGLVRDGEMAAEERPADLKRIDLTLDRTGSARATITELPKITDPGRLTAELDFRDPNGETQTVAVNAPLWPAGVVVGLKTEHWVLVNKDMTIQAAATDLAGKPFAGRSIRVDLFQRKHYSHRKRLVGGFYAYENYSETKKIGMGCEGVTNARGILSCTIHPTESGEIILQARAADDVGRESFAFRSFWAGGPDRWWFSMEDHDRMDVIAEKKRYEPGETARFQIRMPFEKATALVCIEREGVGDVFVRELSGKSPVVEIPIKGAYGPNTFVSVLAVRGRVAAPKPTAMLDLAKPAYKFGVADIAVGWKAYELKVKVAADRPVYRVRENANVKIAVTTASGKPLPAGAEIALAAVDEGLLELMDNASWRVLEAMMGHRSWGVATATAQMHVVGKRHFGLKALPTGGGGGRQSTRELFDTLLAWKARIPVDANGNVTVQVPLNDSITSFRIVAVATGGTDMFGSGSTSIRSIQELSLFSGIAPLVRAGDKILSSFTLRNTTEQSLKAAVSGRVTEIGRPLPPKTVELAAGESQDLVWEVNVPVGVDFLHYDVEAKSGTFVDRVAVTQRVIEAVPVRPVQATVFQLEGQLQEKIEKPADALPGRGGVNVAVRPSLLNGLEAVRRYMRRYPYNCLEQKVSRAISLRDEALWQTVTNELPGYLDGDGLLKYFPSMRLGSDSLTAYVLAVAQEAGWELGPPVERMQEGLRAFIEGRITRYGSLPTADLALRKMAAIEALSRYESAEPEMLASLTIEANLWPTSGVIDWFNVLNRLKNIPGRAEKLRQVEQILRSRLNFQGTVMTFSTEGSDYLWWLMLSNDVNCVKLLASAVEFKRWTPDIARIVRGAISRQKQGHWDLTTANAWGVLALEKFSTAFEKAPVTGTTAITLDNKTSSVNWGAKPKGDQVLLGWPAGAQPLAVQHSGSGKPWVSVQSLAAVPLKAPISSGYRISRTIAPVEQKEPGKQNRGDIVRVRLELEAQTDMTWVVVSDPIPAGAAILGTGLGRDSSLATGDEKSEGWVWPAFEERSFEAFRAYYEYVPKGKWMVEYTVRLNSAGDFNLPPTRVEALYSPEMFGEIPNGVVSVK
ncbi:MAG: alpha-2-macroglobulin [Acidobacteria bacterium]|nr:MAG: alpha-2-macroglobulin [Acidobacteriota bacterium]